MALEATRGRQGPVSALHVFPLRCSCIKLVHAAHASLAAAPQLPRTEAMNMSRVFVTSKDAATLAAVMKQAVKLCQSTPRTAAAAAAAAASSSAGSALGAAAGSPAHCQALTLAARSCAAAAEALAHVAACSHAPLLPTGGPQ